MAKHSAYASLQRASRGLVKRRDGGLVRWLREKWVNLTPYVEGAVREIAESPACGTRHPKQRGKTVCRPTVRVSAKTPALAPAFTKRQIQRAVEWKNKGKVVHWKKMLDRSQ
jgi:hypothetical protein